ncbi:THAP domain-containing 2-like, partial [Paramuricea clavata]
MAAIDKREGACGTKSKKQLGKYCVAGRPGNISCKNNSTVQGISMHGFPKTEGTLRNLWIKFVQRHRPNWQPSPYSALCSAHFEVHFYLQRPDVTVNQLDTDNSFQTKKMLDRKIAYPTIDTVQPEREVHNISDREHRNTVA